MKKIVLSLMPTFLNAVFIYIAIKFVDLWVFLQRMDEANGYMLTHEQEVAGFIRFSVAMSVMQIVILLMMHRFYKKKQLKLQWKVVSAIVNLVLFAIYIFSIYDIYLIQT